MVYLHRNDSAYLEMVHEPVFINDAYRKLFWWHESVHDAQLYAEFRDMVTEQCKMIRGASGSAPDVPHPVAECKLELHQDGASYHFDIGVARSHPNTHSAVSRRLVKLRIA